MSFLDRILPPKESAADRAAWLDNAVRSVAVQAHQHHLNDLRSAGRSFEAAETPAWTDSWPTTAAAINEDLARQLPTLRARARAMARNNEWAIRYLLQLDDNVLGDAGIRLQMRMTKRNGSDDEVPNDRLEGAFTTWGEDCEVSGLCWQDVETMALASLPQDGELLYRLRPGAGPMGFQIQMLDPDLLDVTLRRDWGGNRVRMGVEINDDGKPVAYWLKMCRTGDQASDLITVGRHVRVPADQIRHFFLKRETGQLRGYPWLAAGARRLWLLNDFEESASVASSNAAKRQGFFVSPTGEAPPGFADTIVSGVLESAKAAGKVLTPDEIQAITAAAEKFSTTVPGQFDTIPLGYDFRAFESKWPNVDASSYVKSHLRGWSAARGMSYVTIGNDLESVNYSSAQVGIVGEREHYKGIQARLIRWLHAQVFSAALPYLVLNTPALKMDRLPMYKAAASWVPRRWSPLDPVKAANANEINLRLKLTSRKRIILERGEDPDEVAEEIAIEDELYGPVEPAAAAASATTEDDPAAEDEVAKKFLRRPMVAVRDMN
jgi:lambda family phage portal protein